MQIVGFPTRQLKWYWGCMRKILFVLRFNVPDNSFIVMSGQNHRFLGINYFCGKLMCLAQGHNLVPPVASEDRTQNLLIQSLTLYHYATELSNMRKIFEPHHEKTNNLHMGKQRRRSASR